MLSEMSSRERVLACFNGWESDRAAVINPTSAATVESMEISGVFFPAVHTDPEQMAALAATGHDLLGFDTVSPCFSIHQEAAALGCPVRWGSKDRMPDLREHPVRDAGQFKVPADFLDRKPVRTVLEAIRLLKRQYRSDVAIVGKVMGPWTLSYNLHGTEDFLVETLLEPEKVHQFLDVFKEVSLIFAQAQFEAGADLLTWADHATGDLVSSDCYASFLWPVHKQVNRTLQQMGPVILHTCGNTLDRIGYFAQTGFTAFHFDSKNDPRKAMEIVNGRMLLTGCVNNLDSLLNGSEQDVKDDVYRALDAGIRLISPECAVPLNVPNRNLKAIKDAVIDYQADSRGR